MGPSTEQLEREIVAARADLALTVTELERRARVAPRQLVQDNLPVVAGIGAVVVLLLLLKARRRRR